MTGFDVVVIAPAARHSGAQTAVAQAGGRLLAALDWSQAPALADHVATAPIVALAVEGIPTEALDAALPMLARLIGAAGLRAVVTLDEDQIDPVAAALLGIDGVELLCRPRLATQVTALAVAGYLNGATGLSDRVREEESERERSISAEAARLARIVIEYAERERGASERNGGGVGDRHFRFGFEPPATGTTAAEVRQAIRARRVRDSFFQAGLFEDPAWDMLLDLYAAHLEEVRVSVSSLCIASGVAATTALRWITRLCGEGLLERHPDPSDRRRVFIALSPRALAGMEGYAAALHRAHLPFA